MKLNDQPRPVNVMEINSELVSIFYRIPYEQSAQNELKCNYKLQPTTINFIVTIQCIARRFLNLEYRRNRWNKCRFHSSVNLRSAKSVAFSKK